MSFHYEGSPNSTLHNILFLSKAKCLELSARKKLFTKEKYFNSLILKKPENNCDKVDFRKDLAQKKIFWRIPCKTASPKEVSGLNGCVLLLFNKLFYLKTWKFISKVHR